VLMFVMSEAFSFKMSNIIVYVCM